MRSPIPPRLTRVLPLALAVTLEEALIRGADLVTWRDRCAFVWLARVPADLGEAMRRAGWRSFLRRPGVWFWYP